LKVIENNYSQSEQDQQVRQFVAGGEKPAAILWWPSTATAGVNSVRQLAGVAPVFQTDQTVLPEAKEYVKAFAGIDNTKLGFQNGQAALARRDAAGDYKNGGNVVVFNLPAGYEGGIERMKGFQEATKGAPFNVLVDDPGTIDVETAYTRASQILPKYASQGIDLIYVTGDTLMAQGIEKAMRENNLIPGKNVDLLVGNCAGGKVDGIKDGSVFAATIQSPGIEGMLVAEAAVQFLKNGTVVPGVHQLEATPDRPEATDPYETTYMPNPPIDASSFDSFKLWGQDAVQACV